jgi:L-alanine-DL-glutamate epimerase-like enolase superfamily enzyme
MKEGNHSNRREFIKNAALGVLGSSVLVNNALPKPLPGIAQQTGVTSKITKIEVTLHKNDPNPNPVRDAIQTLPGIGTVMVKVTSDDGVSGAGEIYFGRIDKGLEALKTIIETELKPLVLGSELMYIRQTYENMIRETDYHGSFGISTLGISAIDTALWDCLGKTLQVPCWQLWGGCNTTLPAYANVGWLNYSESKIQQEVEKAMNRGYRSIKIKIGYPTLREDLKRIKAVREVIGDEVILMIDANQSLTVGEAIMRGRVFEDLGCYWFEEPIPAHDVEGYRKIANELKIQLATGENLFSPAEFALFIKRDAVDIVQPDLRRSGGPTALLEIGKMANAFGIPYASHGGEAAHMSVMACLPNTLYVEMGGGDRLINGMAGIPQGPGFSWE